MKALNTLPTTLTAFLLIVGLTVFSACAEEDPMEPDPGVTVEDIEDTGEVAPGLLGARTLYEGYNPYIGQTVTVSGDLLDVYGTNAFTIGESEWTEELLVVVPPNATVSGTTPDGVAVTGFGDLGADYAVQVTGTVRQYVLAEVESEYGLDLDPGIDVEVEEQEPMIVAESIVVVPEEAPEAAVDALE